MSGSNAIAAATGCSVLGRWEQELPIRHGSSKSDCATRTRLSCSCSGSTTSWRPGGRSVSALETSSTGHRRHSREAGQTARSLLIFVAEIESVVRSTQRKFCNGSELSHVAVHHRRMSTISCFRAATSELVSCYSRLSGEVQQQRSSRRRRQSGSIVRALQDETAEQKWAREEQRWLREEQRWFREEQRWERAEARWTETNQALQEEVIALKKELEELRGQRVNGGEITDISLRSLVGGMRNLLQALAVPGSEDLPLVNSPKQIPSSVSLSGGAPSAYAVEESDSVSSPLTFVSSSDEVIALVTPTAGSGSAPEARSPPTPPPSSSQSSNGATTNSPSVTTSIKRTLKSGMEGDDVKQLHDALSELGFYAGEEDVEFSVFSDGTESAVKTWQSSRGVPERGKVTKELMEALLSEVAAKNSLTTDGANKSNSQPSAKTESILKTRQVTPESRPAASGDDFKTREIDRYERSNAQETGTGSSRRVYLLGENRWEEPGRVQRKQDEERRIKNEPTARMKVGVEVCFSCRGVGTMLCSDCEGTGDVNVEEQFLEWLDEDEAKCPYCEGSGAIACDVCDGQAVKVEK